MELHNILPKQDDPQRLLALNGVPQRFWLSAEEINIILNVLARLLGDESALYKGEFPSVPHVEAEHPLPEPGSYAQIIVEGGTNKKASWDNTNKKWFLDGDFVPAGSDAAYLLRAVHDADNDGIIDKAKHIHDVLTAGGTKYYGTLNGVPGVFDFPELGGGGSTGTLPSGFKVINFSNGYQGGLNWKPYANFSFDSNSFSVTANITIDTGAIPAGQKILAALVLNSNGTITLVEGDPSVNPSAPNIDTATQMIPDGGLILLSSGAAVPDEVSLSKIYTNNSGIAGGEADVSVITGGARWNFASNEGDGVCIKGTALLANDQIRFVPGAAIPVGEFTELVFKIHNLVDTGLTSGGGGFRFIVFGNYVDNRGRVRSSNVLLPSFETGGYDVASLDEQFVSLKVQSLSFYEITELRFVFDHADPAVVPTILLDDIKYNDGSAPSGENFATVGYVDRKTQEALDAAKAYADGLALGGGTAPIAYPDMAALYAGQVNQIANGNYRVDDASAHPEVNTGRAWFDYKGTTVGDHTDYILKSEEESLNLDAQLTAIENRLTALEEKDPEGSSSDETNVLTNGSDLKTFLSESQFNELVKSLLIHTNHVNLTATWDNINKQIILTSEGGEVVTTWTPKESSGNILAWYSAQGEAERRFLVSGFKEIANKWENETFNGLQMTQITAPRNPELLDEGGNWLMRFSGAAKSLNLPTLLFPTGNNNYTVIVRVFNRALSNDTYYVRAGSGTANTALIFKATNTGQLNTGWYSNNLFSTAGIINTNQWYNLATIYDGTGREQRIEETEAGADAATGHNLTHSTVPGHNIVGANLTNADIDISDIIIFGGVPTEGDLTKINEFLNNQPKYQARIIEQNEPNVLVKFGIGNDLHHNTVSNDLALNRYKLDAEEKLEAAINLWNKNAVDFVVMNGDYVDGVGLTNAEGIANLETIESTFENLISPRHYVFGNHDLEVLSKSDFLTGTNKLDAYYSFDLNGVHFIILDACYYADEDAAHYDKGNFIYEDTFINPAQRTWLTNDLAATSNPVIIFVHQRLDPPFGVFNGSVLNPEHQIDNAAAVRTILEASGKVIGVFQGHSHENQVQTINGITYYTLDDMTQGAYPDNSVAIVKVKNDNTIEVKGFNRQLNY